MLQKLPLLVTAYGRPVNDVGTQNMLHLQKDEVQGQDNLTGRKLRLNDGLQTLQNALRGLARWWGH